MVSEFLKQDKMFCWGFSLFMSFFCQSHTSTCCVLKEIPAPCQNHLRPVPLRTDKQLTFSTHNAFFSYFLTNEIKLLIVQSSSEQFRTTLLKTIHSLYTTYSDVFSLVPWQVQGGTIIRISMNYKYWRQNYSWSTNIILQLCLVEFQASRMQTNLPEVRNVLISRNSILLVSLDGIFVS